MTYDATVAEVDGQSMQKPGGAKPYYASHESGAALELRE